MWENSSEPPNVSVWFIRNCTATHLGKDHRIIGSYCYPPLKNHRHLVTRWFAYSCDPESPTTLWELILHLPDWNSKSISVGISCSFIQTWEQPSFTKTRPEQTQLAKNLAIWRYSLPHPHPNTHRGPRLVLISPIILTKFLLWSKTHMWFIRTDVGPHK